MNKKYLATLMFFFGMCSLSSISWAGCTSPTGSYTVTSPKQTFSIARNSATRGPIGTVMSIGSGPHLQVNCSAGTVNSYLKFGSLLEPSAFPGVYKTNISGIGIKVWDDFRGTIVVGNDLQTWYTMWSTTTPYGAISWLTNIKMQYYIIGPVETGTVSFPSNINVEAWANTTASTVGGGRYNILNWSGTADVTAAACETPDIKVNIGTIDRGIFIRSATSPTKSFDFKINNCGTGIATVSYLFKPAPGVNIVGTGNNQYLTLDSSSTAKGLGIQVLYENGNNVPFNTKTALTGYNTAGGSYTIPMKARYIRTRDVGDVEVGTASSTAEFEMWYE